MKRSRPDKSKKENERSGTSIVRLKDLIDSTISSPRRVAVPVLIRNGRPCHQQRFSLPSSSSSTTTTATALTNQHIHGQSIPSSSNGSLVVTSSSSSCKNDTPSNLLFNDRQHLKCDNMDLFQQFLLSQWALSKKFFFPQQQLE